LIIRSGSSRAEVLQKGAYLKSLSLGGIDILKPSPDEFPTHGGCAVLLPYAGRVRNAEYTYEGIRYTLPRNNEGNAIHGFLKDVHLQITTKEPSVIELASLMVHAGYPTTLGVKIRYEISSSHLSVSCRATNAGKQGAPLSIGFHPYFLGKEWRLAHECGVEKLEMKDKYFPDGETLPFDFNAKEFDKSEKFDDCFRFPCDARIKTDRVKLEVQKKNMPYAVVFNGKWAEERSVAFEPYTSAPDAFNNGLGLVHLSRGETFECGFDVGLAN
jgi:aldose 1-epimerase